MCVEAQALAEHSAGGLELRRTLPVFVVETLHAGLKQHAEQALGFRASERSGTLVFRALECRPPPPGGSVVLGGLRRGSRVSVCATSAAKRRQLMRDKPTIDADWPTIDDRGGRNVFDAGKKRGDIHEFAGKDTSAPHRETVVKRW